MAAWTTMLNSEWLSLLILIASFPSAAYSDDLQTYEMPGEACGSIIELGDQFKAVSKTENGSYLPNVNCQLTFRTTQDKTMYMRITHFNIEYSPRCEKDKLLIYGKGQQEIDNVIVENDYGICGETKSLLNYYYSNENEVTLVFVTDGHNVGVNNGFGLLITPFSDDGQVECSDGFRCKHGREMCITMDAFCNGENQCGDGSDEPRQCTEFTTQIREDLFTQTVDPQTFSPTMVTARSISPRTATSGLVLHAVACILASWQITWIQRGHDIFL